MECLAAGRKLAAASIMGAQRQKRPQAADGVHKPRTASTGRGGLPHPYLPPEREGVSRRAEEREGAGVAVQVRSAAHLADLPVAEETAQGDGRRPYP